ncbi:MAG: hypothetical protein DYH03_20555 [Nitrospira sp. NTP1]|nr:hypothetical protein [Nitrospira sp. NTP1]
MRRFEPARRLQPFRWYVRAFGDADRILLRPLLSLLPVVLAVPVASLNAYARGRAFSTAVSVAAEMGTRDTQGSTSCDRWNSEPYAISQEIVRIGTVSRYRQVADGPVTVMQGLVWGHLRAACESMSGMLSAHYVLAYLRFVRGARDGPFDPGVTRCVKDGPQIFFAEAC